MTIDTPPTAITRPGNGEPPDMYADPAYASSLEAYTLFASTLMNWQNAPEETRGPEPNLKDIIADYWEGADPNNVSGQNPNY